MPIFSRFFATLHIARHFSPRRYRRRLLLSLLMIFRRLFSDAIILAIAADYSLLPRQMPLR